VVLHRLLGEEQMGSDLAVGVPAGDQRHDLELAGRQTEAGLLGIASLAATAVGGTAVADATSVGGTAVAEATAAAVRGKAAARGKAAVAVGDCPAVEPSPMPVEPIYFTAESGNLSAGHETSG
jgi:hypothetical protein